MPFIHVQMASGRTEEQKQSLLSRITEVTSEALSTPVSSVRVWISEFPATDAMVGGERLSDKKAREATAGGQAGSPGAGGLGSPGAGGAGSPVAGEHPGLQGS